MFHQSHLQHLPSHGPRNTNTSGTGRSWVAALCGKMTSPTAASAFQRAVCGWWPIDYGTAQVRGSLWGAGRGPGGCKSTFYSSFPMAFHGFSCDSIEILDEFRTYPWQRWIEFRLGIFVSPWAGKSSAVAFFKNAKPLPQNCPFWTCGFSKALLPETYPPVFSNVAGKSPIYMAVFMGNHL